VTTRPKRGALGAVGALGALALLTAGGFLIGLGPADAPVGTHSGAAAAEVASGDGVTAPDTAGSRRERSAPSTPVDPQRLKIPALGIDAPVLPIKADGLRLVPPSDPQTVGWWSDGAFPGARRGTAILAGHTVSTGGGVFNDLDQIRPGQRVKIISDGQRLRLRVTSVNIYHKTVLAEHAAEIFDQTRQGRVALVSCDDWTGTDYLSNVVVIARPTR